MSNAGGSKSGESLKKDLGCSDDPRPDPAVQRVSGVLNG